MATKRYKIKIYDELDRDLTGGQVKLVNDILDRFNGLREVNIKTPSDIKTEYEKLLKTLGKTVTWTHLKLLDSDIDKNYIEDMYINKWLFGKYQLYVYYTTGKSVHKHLIKASDNIDELIVLRDRLEVIISRSFLKIF